MKMAEVEIPSFVQNRFWSRVRIGKPNECWIWQAGLNSKKKGFNYGLFWIPKVGGVLAHRLAYALATGQDPTDLDVRHSCDNPPCCNPTHLSLGTHSDNMQDKLVRGRANFPYGIKHPGAKLDEEKVKKMRRLSKLRHKYLKYTASYFAERYGVDAALVQRILKGQAWKHVGGGSG